MEKKINDEFKELVNSGILEEKEALLLSKIRNGEIKNPLDVEIKEETEPTKVIIKELSLLKSEIETEIEATTVVIEKFEKSIEVLSGKTLFNALELINAKDTEKLKKYAEDLLIEIKDYTNLRKEQQKSLIEQKDKLIRVLEPTIDFFELKELALDIEKYSLEDKKIKEEIKV